MIRRPHIAFARIADAALADAEAVVRRWLPGGRVAGGEYLACNPRRADRRPGSFRINLRSGRWADFALGGVAGGDLISLAAYLFDLSQGDAARRLAAMLGIDPHDQY
jgi:hypothetical protein